MGLFLTGSADHALLAMVIKEANQLGSQHPPIGRTTLQKLVYFLNVTGVPMRYRFDIHHYGPYCDDIASDVEWLCADKVILDTSINRNYSNYKLGPHANLLLSNHVEHLQPLSDKIRKVLSALVPLGPKNQELLATLHYLYRQIRVSKNKGPWQKAVTDQFMKLKGERFSKEEVSKAYKAMVTAGLVSE